MAGVGGQPSPAPASPDRAWLQEKGRLLAKLGELHLDQARLVDERARLDRALADVAAAQGDAERSLARLDALAAAGGPGVWRDWGNRIGGGLPEQVLAKVAEKVVAQTEAAWAAWLKKDLPHLTEERIQEKLAVRKREGNCPLFVFAMVCRGWRKAQLKVGGPLRTRVDSDVIGPGSVALAKWALAEGCPRDDGDGFTMAHTAAWCGHLQLVKWLCGEGGFAMDEGVMMWAAISGNVELVRWLRGEGCSWDYNTCYWAASKGHVEVLRWARENGCPWDTYTRDLAAQLGYTDNLGNLTGAYVGNPVQSDDEYESEYSSYSDDEYSSE